MTGSLTGAASSPAPGKQEQRAILYMICAVFLFSLMDVSVKALAPKVGVLPALWARYAGQMLVVTLLILPRARQVVRARYPKLQILRSTLLMVTTAFFFTGISRIPLTDSTALMMINPVLITLGAAFFLGERLGPRRIVGIGIALIGALIIIRPGSAVFSPAALFPLAAAVCYSGYALLTRRVGPDEDVWTSLFYTGLVGTVILSIAVPFAWQSPGWSGLALMLAVACAGTAGQMFLIRAFSQGQAAMLAPYSYVALIFATVWSVLFFSEIPDVWTIVGAVVISCAGLYVWYRETQRH